MRDVELLEDLLDADSESDVLEALNKRALLDDLSRWRYLGDIPNNQAIVNNQQSTAMAALVEKCTNAIDALLLRRCKASGIDPRGSAAPRSMGEAVEMFFGDLEAKSGEERRAFADENLLLYATGSKMRPCLSLYDNGEGQVAEDFPKTFCSLIYGSKTEGSYKGAIPFVQGRFNMGGTGVLPFCSEGRMLQLVASRVPEDVAGSGDHEWAYTLMCFFPTDKDPSWRYLVAADGSILTADRKPLQLVPRMGAKSGKVLPPRERAVASGTLIKMYDFKAPRSNVCGELFKKLGEFLIQPALPLRIIECRAEYAANVMADTLWDRLGALVEKNELEEECKGGLGMTIELSTGETVPGEIRVFKLGKKGKEVDETRCGLHALINGQSHAKRGPEFFRTKRVKKDHIAGSMLVTLDCSKLVQHSRNRLFMADRETFREDSLREELFTKLQDELKDHELLNWLDQKRYGEKVARAVDDEEGLKAMEELIAEDPELAALFGSKKSGSSGSKTAAKSGSGKEVPKPEPFEGKHFPTYFRRADGSTEVEAKVPRGGVARISFVTDVRNNYFTRSKNAGTCKFVGDFAPSYHLYNGRLTFTCRPDKKAAVGTEVSTEATITDPKGSGPFKLRVTATVVPPAKKEPFPDKRPKLPKVKEVPSRPRIREVERDITEPPITIERDPKTDVLEILLNTKAADLDYAKGKRLPQEAAGVEFVFKYGLALIAMALIDAERTTEEWTEDEVKCRKRIASTTSALARVIVPLCLNLPKKLPKAS